MLANAEGNIPNLPKMRRIGEEPVMHEQEILEPSSCPSSCRGMTRLRQLFMRVVALFTCPPASCHNEDSFQAQRCTPATLPKSCERPMLSCHEGLCYGAITRRLALRAHLSGASPRAIAPYHAISRADLSAYNQHRGCGHCPIIL
jgi:hypothetical protein